MEVEQVEERVISELCDYGIWHRNIHELGGLSDVENYLTLWKPQLIPTIS